MRVIEDLKLDFDDCLIVPKRSTLASRQDVSLSRKFVTKYGQYIIEGIPIIAANMSTGNFKMADVFIKNNMFVAISKHLNKEWLEMVKHKDDKINNYSINCFYTIGMCKEELDQLKDFATLLKDNYGLEVQKNLKICIDIANGYSQKFADFVSSVREQFDCNPIMAGNVCTPEMTQELILAGADIIKIGIGPGSQCLTRQKTGCGYPQISASIECSDVAHGLGANICLDGGMTCPGDIAKAFVANADFVMLGGMFSGTDECEGDIITRFENNPGTYQKVYRWNSELQSGYFDFVPDIVEKKYKEFFGMSSAYFQNKNGNKMPDYATSEGASQLIEYKGPVQNILNDIMGGLRSAGTYIGATEIRNFGKCGTLIRCNRQHHGFSKDQL